MTANRPFLPARPRAVPDAAVAPPPVGRGWRRVAALLGLMAIFLAGAVAMGWIAKVGLLDTLAALRAGQPLVTFDPHDAITPFLMVAMLAFFCTGLVARPVAPPAPRRHRKVLPDPRDKAVMALIWVAGGSLVLFPLGPIVANRVFERAATRNGYALCPPLEWEHHPQQRWRRAVLGRAPARCPRTWQEADRPRAG